MELNCRRETPENQDRNRGGGLPTELLDGASLHGVDLREVGSFEDCGLRHADLSGAKFRDVDLTGATLQEADLTDAILWHVDLIGADLSNADLSDVNLSSANLTDADLQNANLSGADLRYADLPDVNLSSADLTGADLRNTNLSGAALQDADLSGATLRDADLTDTELQDSDLIEADLQNSSLDDTNLDNTNLSQANLEGASLLRANLDRTNLTNVRLYNCRLQNVYISNETILGTICAYERATDPWTERLPGYSLNADDITNIEKAASIYRTYQRLHRENSLPGDIPKYYYREREMRWVKALAEGETLDCIYQTLQRWVMGYGERPWRVVGTSLLVIIGFGLVYPYLGGMETTDTETVTFRFVESVPLLAETGWARIFFENLYFSAITFTTLGYGDIQPSSDTVQLLASIESFLGALLMALLVAVLTHRTMR